MDLRLASEVSPPFVNLKPEFPIKYNRIVLRALSSVQRKKMLKKDKTVSPTALERKVFFFHFRL